MNNIPSELNSFHDLHEENQILIQLLKDIHQPIEMILEENARNIDASKEPDISFASNGAVLMGDVSAVANKEEAVPVASG